MLGIVLTSLMIGVVLTPSFHDGRGADVPKVIHPVAMYRADRSDALRITVTKDGRLYLGSETTNEIRIVQDLKARLGLGAEPKLYIEADARARYRTVSEVLDAASSAGIYQVAFLTEHLKTRTNQQP